MKWSINLAPGAVASDAQASVSSAKSIPDPLRQYLLSSLSSLVSSYGQSVLVDVIANGEETDTMFTAAIQVQKHAT